MQVRRRKGTSLVELVCGVAVLGVTLGVSLPRVRAVPRQADAAATRIGLAVAQARRTAVARHCDVLVSVDSAGRRLRLADDVNGNAAIDGAERVRWVPLTPGARFEAPPWRVGGTAPEGAISGEGYLRVEGLPTFVVRPDETVSVGAELYIAQAGAGTELRAVRLARSSPARPERFWFDGNRWLVAGESRRDR